MRAANYGSLTLMTMPETLDRVLEFHLFHRCNNAPVLMEQFDQH